MIRMFNNHLSRKENWRKSKNKRRELSLWSRCSRLSMIRSLHRYWWLLKRSLSTFCPKKRFRKMNWGINKRNVLLRTRFNKSVLKKRKKRHHIELRERDWEDKYLQGKSSWYPRLLWRKQRTVLSLFLHELQLRKLTSLLNLLPT